MARGLVTAYASRSSSPLTAVRGSRSSPRRGPCQVQNNGGTVAGDYEAGGYLRDCDECKRRYAFQQPPFPEHLHRETA